MKRVATKKLVLKRETLRSLGKTRLEQVRGGVQLSPDITHDLECVYWSIFTR